MSLLRDAYRMIITILRTVRTSNCSEVVTIRPHVSTQFAVLLLTAYDCDITFTLTNSEFIILSILAAYNVATFPVVCKARKDMGWDIMSKFGKFVLVADWSKFPKFSQFFSQFPCSIICPKRKEVKCKQLCLTKRLLFRIHSIDVNKARLDLDRAWKDMKVPENKNKKVNTKSYLSTTYV